MDPSYARTQLASGALRGAALRDALLALPFARRDDWLDAALGIETTSPPDASDLPRGAVPYLACGVDEILAVVASAPLRPDDELVDLGSGLGRVVMLAHLLSGARARGIEIQEHLVVAARGYARALGLQAVSFTHANAAEVDLDGSLFFLYAPFNGAMLQSVMCRVRSVAERRHVVVAAVNLELAEDWLAPRPTRNAAVVLYDSV